MSTFWSAYIIILTSIVLIGTVWVLFGNHKYLDKDGTTTGHEYDGINEYDNPLPNWWFYMFVATIVFGVAYLIFYPGMGSYKGLLNWTQVGQWEQRVAKAEEKVNAVFAGFREVPVAELATNRKALKMGQRIFANNCAQCHGLDAKGSLGFPNLTDNDWLYGSDPATIKTSITDGRRGAMPSWLAAMGEKGVVETTQYLRSLGGHAGDPVKIAAGAKNFQTYCASCHGADGKGNPAVGAPNLTDDIWLYGGEFNDIRHSIQQGRNGVMPTHADKLSSDKIHLLSAYVYSLSQPK